MKNLSAYKPNVLYNSLRYSLLITITLCITISRTQGQRQTKNGYISKFGPNAFIGYLAYTPKDYAANPTKKYPLLIFLHGKGEKAWMPKDTSQLDTVKKNGPPHLIELGQDFPFIVISPQCPFEGWDDVSMDNCTTYVSKPGQLVDEVIEKIKNLYRVDPARIYITGLSMGGAGTWNYIVNYPQKIAAAIPISGWIDDQSKVCDIAANNVAVWSFHGADDKTTNTQGTINLINNCRPAPKEAAKITFFTGVGHDAWTKAYSNTGEGIAPDNIYDWLLRHSKTSLLTNIEENTAENKALAIYPVPATNSLSVSYSSERAEKVQIQLQDEWGHAAFSTHVQLENGDNHFSFDLTEIPNGLYFVCLSGQNKQETTKLIVSK